MAEEVEADCRRCPDRRNAGPRKSAGHTIDRAAARELEHGRASGHGRSGCQSGSYEDVELHLSRRDRRSPCSVTGFYIAWKMSGASAQRQPARAPSLRLDSRQIDRRLRALHAEERSSI